MTDSQERDFVLKTLADGFPAITPPFGLSLAEAGAVCFEKQGHVNGVSMQVNGAFAASYNVFWPDVTEQMLRCWNDNAVTTEHGAYGVACLLIRKLTPFTVIERSKKGTGFDYWLGDENDTPFQSKARLEVSGIAKGSQREIAQRVKIKLAQTTPSDGALPAYVIVVEFGTPVAQVASKEVAAL